MGLEFLGDTLFAHTWRCLASDGKCADTDVLGCWVVGLLGCWVVDEARVQQRANCVTTLKDEPDTLLCQQRPNYYAAAMRPGGMNRCPDAMSQALCFARATASQP